jgi:orotate phosphoribosyltransferase
MDPEEARRLLEDSGAILRGHFRLTSGRHSDLYVQKARILERPETAMLFAREIASWYEVIDVVVSPAVGAVPLGFAVALAAGASRSIFAEREDGRMALRRGFALTGGERALVAEDVVTTGGSARQVYELVQEAGALPLGVAALVDRSTGELDFPLRAVLGLRAVSWEKPSCPLCARGEPLYTPGSRLLGRS